MRLFITHMNRCSQVPGTINLVKLQQRLYQFAQALAEKAVPEESGAPGEASQPSQRQEQASSQPAAKSDAKSNKKLIDEICGKIILSFKDFQTNLACYDTQKVGRVPSDRVRMAIQKIGRFVTQQEVDLFCRYYGCLSNGVVEYNELIREIEREDRIKHFGLKLQGQQDEKSEKFFEFIQSLAQFLAQQGTSIQNIGQALDEKENGRQLRGYVEMSQLLEQIQDLGYRLNGQEIQQLENQSALKEGMVNYQLLHQNIMGKVDKSKIRFGRPQTAA